MRIQFWGVRGSIASSAPQHARFGGNTTCVEVTSGSTRLIFDAGTGIRALGEQMMSEARPEATLFFSHLHWDHIQGFPFFRPGYLPNAKLQLIGPGAGGGAALRAALERQMSPPAFPVTLGAMGAQMRFNDAHAGEPLEVGPFRILPLPLPHPQGSMGFRVEADGASFVFATDAELTASQLSPEQLDALRGADVLALDAQYTPDEYAGSAGPSKKGWGHSTNIEAANIARLAGARRLLLTHHDPAHDDQTVDSMVLEAQRIFPWTEAAREGQRLQLDGVALLCA